MELLAKNNQYNVNIYNFLIMEGYKYLPIKKFHTPWDFGDLLKEKGGLSLTKYINTLPMHLIMYINYCQRNDIDINNLFKEIYNYFELFDEKRFTFILDQNTKNFPTKSLINHLQLFYFLCNTFSFVYTEVNNKNNSEKEKSEVENITKIQVEFHLPYCINCYKKTHQLTLFNIYLYECSKCGEKLLRVNNKFYEYIIKKDKNLDGTKRLIEKSKIALKRITNDIFNRFKEKYENYKDKNCQIQKYCSFYKLIREHILQLKIFENITKQKLSIDVEINEGKENLIYPLKDYLTILKNYNINKQDLIEDAYDFFDNDDYENFNIQRKFLNNEKRFKEFIEYYTN